MHRNSSKIPILRENFFYNAYYNVLLFLSDFPRSRLLGRGRLPRRVGSSGSKRSMSAFVSRPSLVFYGFSEIAIRNRDSSAGGAWRVAWGLVTWRGACMRSFLVRLLFFY